MTDIEAEAPILQPPDANSQLIGKAGVLQVSQDTAEGGDGSRCELAEGGASGFSKLYPQ